MESEHAVFCEECSEMECVHCHDFTARTSQEVDEHAKTCPDQLGRWVLMPDQLNVQGVTWFQRDPGGGTLNITPEQERWEPGDVALAADGVLWRRARENDVSDGRCWDDPIGYETGFAENYPTRPLRLLVRGGQVYSGIVNAQGNPVPMWVVKSSIAALEGQLAEVAAEHRALRAGLRTLHRKVETGPDAGHCDSCGFAYPCHTIRLLDARPEGKADQLRASYEAFEAEAGVTETLDAVPDKSWLALAEALLGDGRTSQ